MPKPAGPATSGPPFTRPVASLRPSWRRRIEAFSPKLARRLTFGSYDTWRTWLVIEANPAISSFCERPAYVDGRGAIIDFWVQIAGHPSGEFWLIEDRHPTQGDDAQDDASPSLPDRLHTLPVRLVRQADLNAWAVPIANWARIVPYLVSHRRFRDPLLEQSVVVYLGKTSSLDDVLHRFSDHDSASVEAAVYAVVANGRVLSPDLATSPLSGLTRFRRP